MNDSIQSRHGNILHTLIFDRVRKILDTAFIVTE